MKYSVLQAITGFLFGHKYYANIVGTRGVERYELTSYIFTNKYEADQHRLRIGQTRTYEYIETITFRSRKVYSPVSIKR